MKKIILFFIQPVLYIFVTLHQKIFFSGENKISVRPYTTDLYTYFMIFIQKEYEYNFGFVPDKIIDAGANVGLASHFFHNKYRSASIIAIEPEKSNFDILNKNIAKISNIQSLNAALWYESTTIYIKAPKEGRQKDSFFVGMEKSEDAVPTITPLQLLHNKEGKKILFKIDIESAEKEIFQNDNDEWINEVDGFIIETHDRFKENCEAVVLQKLRKYKFKVEQRKGNLIFAQK